MGFGYGQKQTVNARKLHFEEVKGAWRINIFLCLLTGSQAVLFPWIAVILRDANLTPAEVGVNMGPILLISALSAKFTIVGMEKTKSGAFRRLMLLCFLAISVSMQASSVLFLPAAGSQSFCSVGSSLPPAFPATPLTNFSELKFNISDSADKFSQQSENITDAISNVTTTLFLHPSEGHFKEISSTSSSVHSILNDSKSSTSYSASIADTSPKIKTSTDSTLHKEGSSTTKYVSFQNGSYSSEPLQSQFTLASDISDARNSTFFTESSINHMAVSSQQNLTYNKSEGQGVQVKDFVSVEETAYTGDGEYGSNSGTYTADDADYITSQEISQLVDEDAGKYYPSNDSYEESYGELQNHYAPSKLSGRLANSRLSKEPRVRSMVQLHMNIPLGNREDASETNTELLLENNKLSSRNNEPISKNVVPLFHRSGVHMKNLDTRPFMHYNMGPHFSNMYAGHGVHDNNPLTNVIKETEVIPSQQRPAHNNRFFKEFNQMSPYKSGHIKKKIFRSKQPVGRSKRAALKSRSEKNNLRKKIYSNPRNDSKTNYTLTTTTDVGGGNYSHITVVLMLLLGALLGGGIESSVARLWHCYTHGYSQLDSYYGTESDVIEKTISISFQLSTYGEHRAWSCITSAAWCVSAVVLVGILCTLGNSVQWFYSILGGIHGVVGALTVVLLLVIPVPWGSLTPPRTRRPLSLYLDDEVLQEGLRRLAFHIWVFVSGILSSLPCIYGVWLLDETSSSAGVALGCQALANALSLVGEGLTLPARRWFTSRLSVLGLMATSAFIFALQGGLIAVTGNCWLISIYFLLEGFGVALLWIAATQNAFLLATVRDQEKEAWVSWFCRKLGLAIGAVTWGTLIDGSWAGGFVKPLFTLDAIAAMTLATAISCIAVFTRSRRRNKQRIYHTLDLYAASNDELGSGDEAEEDDWLVKRAKKEGITL